MESERKREVNPAGHIVAQQFCCGSAKDRLRVLAVTQKPHNSSLTLIDLILLVLRSNRTHCIS